MKTINLALRGGAAEMLDAIVPFELELEQKLPTRKYKVGISSGASAGGLSEVKWANGIFGKEACELMKSLDYDYVYRNTGRLQDEDFPIIGKAFLAVPTFIACKTKVSRNILSIFESNFSWKQSKKIDYFDKIFITIADTNEIAKLYGSKNYYSFVDIYYGMVKKGEGRLDSWVRKIWIYYASDDGVYAFNSSIGFMKISNFIIPQHEAAFATFVNPLLKRMEWEFDILPEMVKYIGKKKIKITAFDGGIFNNEANLPFFGRGCTYHQISIRPVPSKTDPSCISDRFYNLKPTTKDKFHILTPVHKKINFFGLDNQKVDRMYRNRKPTNILR